MKTFPLSDRQHQIHHFLKRGWKPRRIATALGIGITAVHMAAWRIRTKGHKTGKLARNISPATTLSPRQREVLTLADQGCTYRQIGETLGIALGTVAIHLGAARLRLKRAKVQENPMDDPLFWNGTMPHLNLFSLLGTNIIFKKLLTAQSIACNLQPWKQKQNNPYGNSIPNSCNN